MADTYVKKIVAAIVGKVDATGKPTGLVVSTSRKKPTQPSAGLSYIAVYPVRDEAAPENSAQPRTRTFPAVRRLLHVELMCRCAGTDLDNEALRAWAWKQIATDVTLGGAALGITEGDTEWQGAMDSEADYSQAPMIVLVEYTRPRNTLECA